MATVLSYARPERRTPGRYVGPIAIVVAVGSSILVVTATLITRYALASYVQVGWCGTPRASLEVQLYELPAMLFVPCAVAAGIARYLDYRVVISRISLWVAILGWATCAFVG